VRIDPYETLGVNRDAPMSVIRRAYLTHAKRAHPDCGGSAEDFHALQTAYGILVDPNRRKTFDETGQADPIDAAIATTALDGLLAAIVQILQNGMEPDEMDLIEVAIITLKSQLATVVQAGVAGAKAARRLSGVRSKFKRRPGVRTERDISLNEILKAAEARQKMQNDTQRKVIEAAIETLKAYKYEASERRASRRAYGTGYGGVW
jgi:curved DNA-binding protein CbpA